MVPRLIPPRTHRVPKALKVHYQHEKPSIHRVPAVPRLPLSHRGRGGIL